MRFVTISKKGAARRVPGQSPRRAEARGGVQYVHWRGTRSIWHSQALAGICRHSQAPCRIEQQLNRARLQLCFEPSLSPHTPEPVDSQPPSQDGPALISRDSICWRPHSRVALPKPPQHGRAMLPLLHFTAHPVAAAATSCACFAC
jgi:hypothetical protein